MDWKRVIAGVAALVAVACGGGGDSGTNPGTNTPPVIAFAFVPMATEKNIPVDLTVTATDADDDPLTITWTVTRGSLAAQNSKKTVMRWTVPSTVGVDTVNISVSDGTVTRKLTEEIRVATKYQTGSFLKSASPYIRHRRHQSPAGSSVRLDADNRSRNRDLHQRAGADRGCHRYAERARFRRGSHH